MLIKLIKLLSTYDQNLILLNFIRNLWHSPTETCFPTTDNRYATYFFEALEKSTYIDPLKRLTNANKKACEKYGYKRNVGHSNVAIGSSLVLKDKESLLKWQGVVTNQFLTKP